MRRDILLLGALMSAHFTTHTVITIENKTGKELQIYGYFKGQEDQNPFKEWIDYTPSRHTQTLSNYLDITQFWVSVQAVNRQGRSGSPIPTIDESYVATFDHNDQELIIEPKQQL